MPKHANRIEDVEIFRVGTWNGLEFTEAHLDEMVGAFDKVGFTPALKVDTGKQGRPTHAPGGPAFGWVESIRRVGDRLLATFRDVPSKLLQAIREKSFDRVSAEIFTKFERNGQKFGRVLSAVELLGAAVPAVAGLKPVSESLGFSADVEGQESITATIEMFAEESESVEEAEMPDKDKLTEEQREIKAKLDESIAKLAEAEAKVAALTEEVEKGKQSKPDTFAESEERKALEAKIATLEEKDRQGWRNGLVGACKIPALRRHVAIFADLASTKPEDEVFTFSETDKDGKIVSTEMKPRDAVESFVRDVNANAAILFQDTARAKHERAEDVEDVAITSYEAGEKLHAFAMEIQKKNDGVDYAEALHRAREEHPDLKQIEAQG